MSLSAARPERRRLARAAALFVLVGGLSALAAELVLRPSIYLDVAAVLATLASVAVLARLRVAGRSRPAQGALLLWALSLLLQLAFLRAPADDRVGWATGIARTVPLLAGPLVAGIAIGRAGLLTGWRRWVPLAFGIAQSAEILPVALGLAVGLGAAVDGVADVTAPALTLLLVIALLSAYGTSAWVERWRRSGSVLDVR